jgi:hypothetical protein
MRAVGLLYVVGLCVACGGGYVGDHAKTPAEIVAEEERQAAKDEEQAKLSDTGFTGDVELESDKVAKFDERQAEMELKRAARSAVTCPGSIGGEEKEKLPSETTVVTVTFANQGHVKSASIDAAYADSPVGKCVLRAMEAVIVPRYKGSEVTKQVKIDFSEAAQEEGAKKKP